MIRIFTTLFTLLLLGGCSSKPVLPLEGADTELTAQHVAETGEQLIGKRVAWGGVIVSSSNLKEQTLLEVVAYPLNKRLEPLINKQAGHRFLAYRKGYLETVDYAAGRRISVVGRVAGIEQRPLGEHPYTYPAIEVEQLYLWPLEPQQSEPSVRFGIGVMFHN
jgi:outer membrane lipoprotein